MKLNTTSALLNLMGVKHNYVEAAKRFEDTIELDDAMDKYVDGVVRFLIKLSDSKTRVLNGTSYTFDQMGLNDPTLRKIFGNLNLTLIKPTMIEPGNGLPLGGKGKDLWRACYRSYTGRIGGEIVFPYIEGSTGLVMAKRVRSFHAHQVVSHEVQHYLDYNGFNDEVEMETLKEDHERPWIERTTEFNAVTRELIHSVRRLLQEISKDQESTKPRFKPEKIANLFGHQFESKDVFFRSIFQSMMHLRSEIAVFEFGEKSHVAELYTRYSGARGEYRFAKEFESRLTEIWRYVRDWYMKLNAKLNLDGKQKSMQVKDVKTKKGATKKAPTKKSVTTKTVKKTTKTAVKKPATRTVKPATKKTTKKVTRR